MDEALTTDSFASLIGGDGDNEQTDNTDSQSDDTTEQETEQETAQDDAPEQEEGDAEQEQDEQPEKDSTEAFLELEIDGKKVLVSKDEAKNGYLRQQDYTQKAQNLARERSEAQAHIQQQFAQVQQFSAEIGQLTNLDATLSQYQNVDWAALRESDPLSYSTHLAEYNDMRARRSDMVQAIGSKQQQFAQQQQQQFAQQTQEAQTYLQAKIPGFGKEHLAQMTESGVKHGFTKDELANVADKRMLEVLWKASEYDKSQVTTQKAVKAVAALPTKANKPAPSSKPANEINIDKQTKRVQQSGKLSDFAALLGMASKG